MTTTVFARLKGVAILAIVLLTTVLGSTGAHAALTYSLPGIRASGYPNFQFGDYPDGTPSPNGKYSTKVTIIEQKTKGTITGYEMTATAGGAFYLNMAPGEIYEGSQGSFDLFASFDASENLISDSGWVSISGTIDIGAIHIEDEVLMTADLDDWAYGAYTYPDMFGESLIGFNTSNIYCNPLLPINCTDGESVYLIMKNLFTGLEKTGKPLAAISITTVPVPATVYLFGSGLLGLAGLARKKWSGLVVHRRLS